MPDRLPIDGPWSIVQGQHNDKIMIVRLNTGYKEFGGIHGYEYQVGIAVPLHSPEPTGLPSPEEDSQLGEIEDAIGASLEQQAESLFVAIITTSGMREFVFYTRDPEQVKQRFRQLQSVITSHEIQLMIRSDKDWEVYGQIA
ncbi:MAG: DUF695 domain-containing protein [Candidatus Riflebacteria bacterium]|nr:DUF695 domain-containing protein [Candidatus Riflebacteria bacterium]